MKDLVLAVMVLLCLAFGAAVFLTTPDGWRRDSFAAGALLMAIALSIPLRFKGAVDVLAPVVSWIPVPASWRRDPLKVAAEATADATAAAQAAQAAVGVAQAKEAAVRSSKPQVVQR